ncbi:hypothetical protein ACFYE2_06990 [Kocuria sp. CPCC 205300]|uniref:hypothetical protein n=1 Tax=Kocuria sabuli TaxID=3071448 RepID=UPI0036D8686E
MPNNDETPASEPPLIDYIPGGRIPTEMSEPDREPSPSPLLSDYVTDMGIPTRILQRQRLDTGSPLVQKVLELKRRQPRRRYLLGVLLAYIGVAEALAENSGLDHIDDVLNDFPPKKALTDGSKVNTLTLECGEKIISLRSYYNSVERTIRHNLHRPDYPNSAPHATQSWDQHRQEFELICRMDPGERAQLLELLWQQVLAIPELEADVRGVRELRPFGHILDNFSSAVAREPGGAVLQGLAYAYYRADSPSVTLRVFKVGSGSSRVGAAGDVDGWIGGTLALSVEVKDMDITEDDIAQFDQFIKQLRRWPNCTAVVLANKFSSEAQDYLSQNSILVFDRSRMSSNVSYWDMPKQKMAVQEFYYYLKVVQNHGKLLRRFEEFCATAGIGLSSSAESPAQSTT